MSVSSPVVKPWIESRCPWNKRATLARRSSRWFQSSWRSRSGDRESSVSASHCLGVFSAGERQSVSPFSSVSQRDGAGVAPPDTQALYALGLSVDKICELWSQYYVAVGQLAGAIRCEVDRQSGLLDGALCGVNQSPRPVVNVVSEHSLTSQRSSDTGGVAAVDGSTSGTSLSLDFVRDRSGVSGLSQHCAEDSHLATARDLSLDGGRIGKRRRRRRRNKPGFLAGVEAGFKSSSARSVVDWTDASTYPVGFGYLRLVQPAARRSVAQQLGAWPAFRRVFALDDNVLLSDDEIERIKVHLGAEGAVVAASLVGVPASAHPASVVPAMSLILSVARVQMRKRWRLLSDKWSGPKHMVVTPASYYVG